MLTVRNFASTSRFAPARGPPLRDAPYLATADARLTHSHSVPHSTRLPLFPQGNPQAAPRISWSSLAQSRLKGSLSVPLPGSGNSWSRLRLRSSSLSSVECASSAGAATAVLLPPPSLCPVPLNGCTRTG